MPENKTFDISFKKRLAGYAFISICILFAYSNTFGNPFVFDDKLILEELFSGKSFSDIVFHSGWRPILNLSLYLNHKISGNEVWSYHVFNVIVHIISAILLFEILYYSFLNRKVKKILSEESAFYIALCSAVLWGVHPLNTEAVTYIVQRCESMTGMFSFLALFCIIKGSESKRHKIWWYIIFIISSLLGFGCKEAMISTPIGILLYDRMFLSESVKDLWKKRGILYTVFFVFLTVPAVISGFAIRYLRAAFANYGITAYEYFLTQCKVIVHYIKLVFIPAGLCFDYVWGIDSHLATVFPYFLFLLLLFGITLVAYFRNKPLSYLGIWFFVYLAPRSSFAPRPDAAVEHRMYMPSAAVVVFAVLFLYFLIKKIYEMRHSDAADISKSLKKAFCISGGIIICGFGYLTFDRNKVYASELALWKDTVLKRPKNPRALNYLGIEYSRRKKYKLAKKCFEKALELYPEYDMALNNMANMLAMAGSYDEALLYYKRSLAIKRCEHNKINRKTHSMTYKNMGKIYIRKKEYDKAYKYFGKAVKLRKSDTDSYIYLAFLSCISGRNDNIDKYIKSGLKYSKNEFGFLYAFANMLKKHKRYKEAAKQYIKLLETKPSDVNLNYEYAACLLQLSQLDEAEKYLKKVIKIDSEFPLAYNDLGVIAKRRKQDEAAEKYFRKAISLKPNYAAARFNLGILLGEHKKYRQALKQLYKSSKLRPDQQIIKGYIMIYLRKINKLPRSKPSHKF